MLYVLYVFTAYLKQCFTTWIHSTTLAPPLDLPRRPHAKWFGTFFAHANGTFHSVVTLEV